MSAAPSSSPQVSFLPFVAGGLGGMCGAIVTSPFDVVKTRLQSSFFPERAISLAASGVSGGAAFAPPPRPGLLYNFIETGNIIRDIYRVESPRALFKGLGPSLVGVVPARSISFFAYGNSKQFIANRFNNGQENSFVHLGAAVVAGLTTGTVTNPLWVVKTRLQLESGASSRNAFGAVQTILRDEGIRGLYKGLSASYLGVVEIAIQFVMYERLKRVTAGTDAEWLGMVGGAGAAKFVAALVAYPHEVIRTRLRQPKVNGVVKYTGLMQTLRLIVAEEGARRLYGGLSAHLMRVVPNAAVMFSIYEGILRWGGDR